MPPAENDISMAGNSPAPAPAGQLPTAMATSPWPCCADSDGDAAELVAVDPCCACAVSTADCRRHSATTLNSLSSCAYKGFVDSRHRLPCTASPMSVGAAAGFADIGLADVDPEDVDSVAPGRLAEGDLHSLHRNVPALRRTDLDTAAIRQHFYPEGGWGWVVCGAAFVAHLLSGGLILAGGAFAPLMLRHMPSSPHMETVWVATTGMATSFLIAPISVAACRRKSTRLAAALGGLAMTLAFLFTSFAHQLHQSNKIAYEGIAILCLLPEVGHQYQRVVVACFSYGVLLGASSGVVRDSASLILATYFKRRRELVEAISMSGTGIGVAVFSAIYSLSARALRWRSGLQVATGIVALSFFLVIAYRPASLYHPQRRAILHLKAQRRRVIKHKKAQGPPRAPIVDWTPLRARAVRLLLGSASCSALGLYAPALHLALDGREEGIVESGVLQLQVILGLSSSLGSLIGGVLSTRRSTHCYVSRQCLCQLSLLGSGLALLALGSVRGYHGYVLLLWLYGSSLGGALFSLKMLTMERVRARYFTRTWAFVQAAQALPALVGVPVAGYINESHPRAGYYLSCIATLVGALLLFLVGLPDPGPITGDADPCTCDSGCNPLQPAALLPPPPPPPPPPMHLSMVLDMPLPPPQPLRATRSVPEGLYRRSPYPYGFYNARHYGYRYRYAPSTQRQFVEQMTTSV